MGSTVYTRAFGNGSKNTTAHSICIHVDASCPAAISPCCFSCLFSHSSGNYIHVSAFFTRDTFLFKTREVAKITEIAHIAQATPQAFKATQSFQTLLLYTGNQKHHSDALQPLLTFCIFTQQCSSFPLPLPRTQLQRSRQVEAVGRVEWEKPHLLRSMKGVQLTSIHQTAAFTKLNQRFHLLSLEGVQCNAKGIRPCNSYGWEGLHL